MIADVALVVLILLSVGNAALQWRVILRQGKRLEGTEDRASRAYRMARARKGLPDA